MMRELLNLNILACGSLDNKLSQKSGFFYRNRSSFPVVSRNCWGSFQFWIMGMYFSGTSLWNTYTRSIILPADLLLMTAMVLTILCCMIRWVGLLWQRGIKNTGICLSIKTLSESYHLALQWCWIKLIKSLCFRSLEHILDLISQSFLLVSQILDL